MSDSLTREQLQIKTAYGRIQKHIQEVYEGFMSDAESRAEDFEGITADDAYVWFIESF